jgi:hypothetical protein
MRRLLVLTALLIALGAGSAFAQGFYPPPAYYYPPYPAYPVYPAPPVYGYTYPPPAFYFGSGYDPDYRAMRYNHYFSRYQDAPPRVEGFTLR